MRFAKNIFYSKFCLITLASIISISFIFSTTASALVSDSSEYDQQLELDIAEALELILEGALLYDANGKVLGYNKDILEGELKDNSLLEEILLGLETENLLVSESHIQKENANIIRPMVVACGWYLKNETAEYANAKNKCALDGLKSNYTITAISAGVVNAIYNKEYKKAAGELIKSGLKANAAGVVVVLGVILTTCISKMEKQFPGDSNCE